LETPHILHVPGQFLRREKFGNGNSCKKGRAVVRILVYVMWLALYAMGKAILVVFDFRHICSALLRAFSTIRLPDLSVGHASALFLLPVIFDLPSSDGSIGPANYHSGIRF